MFFHDNNASIAGALFVGSKICTEWLPSSKYVRCKISSIKRILARCRRVSTSYSYLNALIWSKCICASLPMFAMLCHDVSLTWQTLKKMWLCRINGWFSLEAKNAGVSRVWWQLGFYTKQNLWIYMNKIKNVQQRTIRRGNRHKFLKNCSDATAQILMYILV